MEVVNDIAYPEEHIDRMCSNGYSLEERDQMKQIAAAETKEN